jgi:hypothetical protein
VRRSRAMPRGATYEHEQPLTLDQTDPARFRARAGDHGPRRLRRARFYVRRSVAEHTVATIAIQYVAGFYLAGAIGATYTLRQATWSAARTYLASALALIGVFTLITIVGLLTPPGLQPIACLYVLLSILSLPLVAWVWRQEAARMAAHKQSAAVVRT